MKEYSFEINGRGYDVAIKNIKDSVAEVVVNGTAYTVRINNKTSNNASSDHDVKPNTTDVTQKVASRPRHRMTGVTIKSPLPGVISAIRVKIGDKVSVGQELVVLEAMKMENSIESEAYGTIKEIHVEKGDSVLEGEAIITIG